MTQGVVSIDLQLGDLVSDFKVMQPRVCPEKVLSFLSSFPTSVSCAPGRTASTDYSNLWQRPSVLYFLVRTFTIIHIHLVKRIVDILGNMFIRRELDEKTNTTLMSVH